MKRQTSILSFLQKPSPENQKSEGNKLNGQQVLSKQVNQSTDAANQATTVPKPRSLDDVRGTDTPPEKVPRRVLLGDFSAVAGDGNGSGSGASVFSSIMHKFVKVDGRENSRDRKDANVDPAPLCLKSAKCNETLVTSHTSNKENTLNLDKSVDDDLLGPETPGTRPLISCLKRIQEDADNYKGKKDSSASDPFKRVKFLQDMKEKSEKHVELSEMTSKFEWLDPSRIRDANGRRPSDPLYNKKTLYIPPEVLKKMSASQKQYWSIKSQYMDLIVFFKVGKFYELYELDAEIGHRELDWKMTFSGVGKCRQFNGRDQHKPLFENSRKKLTQLSFGDQINFSTKFKVGISESGIDDAVQKLMARGHKVGRIEQLETSEQAKSRGSTSVIQRKLVQVLTPSTTTEGNIGPDAVLLLAIKEINLGLENGSNAYGFAFVDCAALKFWVGSVSDDASCAALGALMMQVSPKEIIYETGGLSSEAQKVLKKYSLTGSVAAQLTPAEPAVDFIDPSEVRNLIQSKKYFQGSCSTEDDDDTFNQIMQNDFALSALGGLISHLSRLMLVDDLRNGHILPYEVYKGCLRMDGQTLVNLEIFSNTADGGSSGTLFKYLDNCVTPAGKRLLRSWICHPLTDVEKVNFRLDVVDKLISHSEVVLLIAQSLRKLPDLERFLGRIKATVQSSASISLPVIGNKILKQRVKVFGSLLKGLRVAVDLLMLLQKENLIIYSLSKIVNIPNLSGNDGLDKFLTQFEAAIDSDFPKYQDHEVKDTDAEMLSILIELFIEKSNQWSEVIHSINCIDVLRSFALISKFSSGPMCRPTVLQKSGSNTSVKGPSLRFEGLWHPFALVGDNCRVPVPNDIILGEDSKSGYRARSLLLTGPNMGGKSTLLRATCLAVILAQLGCYVPCETCVVSLVDIIFTRLGATDHIMTGESTFFIECKETSSVLQNATQDSLVILDELGRGTSTFDGYAIAYAVFRHLVEKVNCRLLFATHYHPLTKEFGSHPHVNLQHMACSFKSNTRNATSSKTDQDLVFLYKLAAGACPESYGMQVALMAGIPKPVVESAYNAGKAMKKMIGESFKSSEMRSEFSTLHEEWLKTILTQAKADRNGGDENDVLDTLFCVWHEIKCSLKAQLNYD